VRDLVVAVRARLPRGSAVAVSLCDPRLPEPSVWQVKATGVVADTLRLGVRGDGLAISVGVPITGLSARESIRVTALSIVEAIRPAMAVRVGVQPVGIADAELQELVAAQLVEPPPPRQPTEQIVVTQVSPPAPSPWLDVIAHVAVPVVTRAQRLAPEALLGVQARFHHWITAAELLGGGWYREQRAGVTLQSWQVGAALTLGYGDREASLVCGPLVRLRSFAATSSQPDLARTAWWSQDVGGRLTAAFSPFSGSLLPMGFTTELRGWLRPRSIWYRDQRLLREPTLEVVVGLGGAWSLW